ncbi:MAG: hypothetical protein OXC98_11020 [bacterium]|nr:hypothetical protein [Acidimicrobiia bacterium]MCY4650880.1 hypothetical protein [bacterium]
MPQIPEELLRRSAEAKAKALGLPVEQVLAEMRGEAPVTEMAAESVVVPAPKFVPTTPYQPVSEIPPDPPPPDPASAPPAAVTTVAEEEPAETPAAPTPTAEAPAAEAPPAAAAPEATDNGASGNGRLAAVVSVRPSAPPADLPEGVRHQRLLTVVKARAIQQVKADPTDKVNTWPHLMITEFTALLAMTAFLLVLSVILQAPLLEAANFNATPNPSKAPWYFLGLQEMLSYFDPQIAGVTVPTVIGIVGFMMIPYIDRNPSTRPSDRKLAIMLYTIFLTGSATLTILGVLFRGPGFNFAYPWVDGVFFDDLKDWVDFGGH